MRLALGTAGVLAAEALSPPHHAGRLLPTRRRAVDGEMERALEQLGLTPAAPTKRKKSSSTTTTTTSTLLEFARRGHCVTRELLAEVDTEALTAIALREAAAATAHAERVNVGDEWPFLQTFNPHRTDPKALTLARCEPLVDTACLLLDAASVQLYQTSIFHKRAGDAATNWHSDLGTSVLDTNDFVTAWIPLQDVPEGGTGLLYAEKSHADVALAFWASTSEAADDRYALADHGALSVGDVSWHHGWTLHSAAENDDAADRFAFAVSYFAAARLLDSDALATKVNDEDEPSYAAWIHDFQPGDLLVDHPALPEFHPSSSSSSTKKKRRET